MQWLTVVQDVFNKPPIPYEPAKHTLKAWAQYCLRDRGFKVVYTDKADFAIELRGGEKLRFRVTENKTELSDTVGWIVYDAATRSTQVIPPPAG